MFYLVFLSFNYKNPKQSELFLYLGADPELTDVGFDLSNRIVNPTTRNAKKDGDAEPAYDANNDLHEKLIKTQVSTNS